MNEPRELAVLLDNGHVIREEGWHCVADVIGSYHGFLETGGRVYGTIVDAETLQQVYPLPLTDPTASPRDNRTLG